MKALNVRQLMGLLLPLVVLIVSAYFYSQTEPGTGPTPTEVGAPITEEPWTAGQPDKFDFYILSLSWSPDYCNSNGAQDPEECSIGKKLGFVLHGLWPQYDNGYPSNCSNTRLTESIKAKFIALYPSIKLYDHEWEKHGTCSGLTPDRYLALTKKLKDSLVIPSAYRSPEQPFRTTAPQLKKDFQASNVGLAETSLAVYCSGSGRFLQELYVCYLPEGKPAACSAEIQRNASRSCGNPDFLVRNVR